MPLRSMRFRTLIRVASAMDWPPEQSYRRFIELTVDFPTEYGLWQEKFEVIVSTFVSDNLATAPAYWFLNALHILLAQNKTEEGAYSLLHVTADPDFETPYHFHDAEDEAFYVLEGEFTFVHAGKTIEAGPGSYLCLERGVPHGFRNSSGKTSRVLIHAIPGGKVGFVGMMLELATPLMDRDKLPAATPPDLKQLTAACERNGIHILGPLPL